MKLALCIPTHHGRADTLRTLLDSVVSQKGLASDDVVEICISDNASEDGTAELVATYQRTSPFPITYFRFPTDTRGVRNFVNVVEMASAEWCWFVGSDDVLLPGALARALEVLRADPEVPGVTVNKVNFDRTLTRFHSVDHEIVLPRRSAESHLIAPFSEVVADLAMSFGYMSAHLFRREDWRGVIRDYGLDYLLTLRHFVHCFAFAEIAKRRGAWYWLAEYLVVQRLDNFCVLESVGGRQHQYATELTEDLVAVYTAVLGQPATTHAGLMRRLFIIYWTPWLVFRYRASPGLSREASRALAGQCLRWFRRLPIFWLTAFPLLLAPRWILRPLKRATDAAYRWSGSHPSVLRIRRGGSALFHAILRLLRVERGDAARTSAAHAAAMTYLRG
jgi:abequosyltransferase